MKNSLFPGCCIRGEAGRLLMLLASLFIAVGFMTPSAMAGQTLGSNFTMIDGSGGLTGGTNDVVFTWDGSLATSVAPSGQVPNATIASDEPFFGLTWAAHDVELYAPGTYTVYDGCPAGSPGCGTGSPVTFTVGAGQVGAHMLFKWGVTDGIDVVDVWNPTTSWAAENPGNLFHTGADNGTIFSGGVLDGAPNTTSTLFSFVSTDWDGDGIAGAGMTDGPFVGFNANFNLTSDFTNPTLDTDQDGLIDEVDNCPDAPNGPAAGPDNQLDSDADGLGDVCDSCPNDAQNDTDGDGVCGDVDNCPDASNADQKDGSCVSDVFDPNTSDGTGDACEDSDGDGVLDSAELAAGTDPCDPASKPGDQDNDGIPDTADNCPDTSNSDQKISFPALFGPGGSQAGGYLNGIGDACNTDDDGDGFPDACPPVDPTCPVDFAPLDPDSYPGAQEICDDKDNDGDGEIDEGLNTYYKDADGDGYGDPNNPISSICNTPPAGFVVDLTDCNDSNKSINPGAGELCDGIDNNCSGQVDEGIPQTTYFVDADGDGFGDPASPVQTCETTPPSGTAANADDCDDTDPFVNPKAKEILDNGIDDNCDGMVDVEVKQIPPGRYIFDINPDLPNIRAGAKPNLKSYFAFTLSNKFRALSSYLDTSELTTNNNGLPGNTAGLISFELVPDFQAMRDDPAGPQQVTANIILQGLPKSTDAQGKSVYAGDYKMGSFTSPGGHYQPYVQADRVGRYDPADNSLEFYLGEVDPDTGASDINVLADTQNAGLNIVFPYDPIGTGSYTNFKPEPAPGGCAISSTVDTTISGTPISYVGKVFLYDGIASFAQGEPTDMNGDGTIDDSDVLIDANEDGAIDLNDVPDDIAGAGVDTNGDGIGDQPDGIVDDNDKVDAWAATLATAGNVPVEVAGFACVAYVHVYDGLIIPSQNTPPTADAGNDVTVAIGDTVSLDGTGSGDPEDGTVSEYAWDLISWPVASKSVLIGRDTARPAITVDMPGEYVASLAVKDSKGASSLNVATVKITAGAPDCDGICLNAIDTDGDGIPDWEDDCPNNKEVTCKDTDHDGVLDSEDNSPGDPAMTLVTEGACEIHVRAGVGLGGAAGTNKVSLRHVKTMSTEGIADLPENSVLLSYDIDVTHPSIYRPDGAEVAVTIDIPCGITNPEVFKIVNGEVKTLRELGINYTLDTLGSRTITLTLKDGRGGDDQDLKVNGTISDPIGIGETAPAAGGRGGGGGGCGLGGQPSSGDGILLLLPVFALAGLRWAGKRAGRK